jgi:hypothetical protein
VPQGVPRRNNGPACAGQHQAAVARPHDNYPPGGSRNPSGPVIRRAGEATWAGTAARLAGSLPPQPGDAATTHIEKYWEPPP